LQRPFPENFKQITETKLQNPSQKFHMPRSNSVSHSRNTNVTYINKPKNYSIASPNNTYQPMTYQQIETQKTLKTGPNALSPHKRAKSVFIKKKTVLRLTDSQRRAD
jgi:hypothetical protein